MKFLREDHPVRIKSLLWLGKARWLLGTVLFILGATATFLGVPSLSEQLRSQVPGLRCWYPVPMDDSKFNIVMTPFVTVDGKGADSKVSNRRDGDELARLLYSRLENSFSGLQLNVPYALRSPDDSCPVNGATPDSRAAAAEQMAATINANIIIYGAIQNSAENTGSSKTPTTAQLQPEFFVAYRGSTEAGDLVGPHELGSPLPINLPVKAGDLEGIADYPVNARAQALSLITLGLASYVNDDYPRALDYFSAADQVPNWLPSAGKETLYVLMGNTASRLAATTRDSAYVDEALDNFDKALEINPNYARAIAGEASAQYQLALGDLKKLDPSKIDLGLLEQAEATFQRAAAASAPEAAEIGLKTQFGLGQIYLVRYFLKVPGRDWLAQARAQFQAMIDSYSANGARNHDLIGHAYARLALINDQIDKDSQAAIPLYQQAIPLVTPRWQAYYQLDLGDVYAKLKDVDNARKLYQAGQAQAELYNDQTLAQRAADSLAKLQ